MSDDWICCTTRDGKWGVSYQVDRILGDTTKWISINDAAEKPSRRVKNDRVSLYDVDPWDVYFSHDGKWLFTIDHGLSRVYYLPTGARCDHVGDRWVAPKVKARNSTASNDGCRAPRPALGSLKCSGTVAR